MIKRITSKDNVVIKKMKQLEAKKYRDKSGLFILEGITVLKEAFETEISLELAVYSDSFTENPDALEIIGKLQNIGVPTYSVDDKLFASISGTDTPQGIIVAAKKPEWTFNFLKDSGSNVIVLDRVSDPGNVGTIIRTAEAAGFGGIIVLKGSADPYSGKVSRSAAGSLMRLPIVFVDTPEEMIKLLKESNKKIICTDPRSQMYYFNVNLSYNSAIIIGNEASGVCNEIFENADTTVGIPMLGVTESLNAAVASSILMYETVRQKLK